MLKVYPEYLPGRYGLIPNTEIAQYPTTIANAATTTVCIGNSNRRQAVFQCFISALILPTSAGTITITFKKWSVSGNAFVLWTAAQDITVTTQTIKVTFIVPLLTTLTDPQRTLLPGDTIYADFIASGTVTGQATAAICGVELGLLQ